MLQFIVIIHSQTKTQLLSSHKTYLYITTSVSYAKYDLQNTEAL